MPPRWPHHSMPNSSSSLPSSRSRHRLCAGASISPETLRFFLLSTHYRRPIDYGEERLQEIHRGLEGFHRLFERFQRIAGTSFFELPAPTKRAAFDATVGNTARACRS